MIGTTPRVVETPGVSTRNRLPLLEPWLYLSPALLLIALVMIVPLIVGLSYAFQDIQILNPFKKGWVGLKNFEALWADRNFWRALGNTFY